MRNKITLILLALTLLTTGCSTVPTKQNKESMSHQTIPKQTSTANVAETTVANAHLENPTPVKASSPQPTTTATLAKIQKASSTQSTIIPFNPQMDDWVGTTKPYGVGDKGTHIAVIQAYVHRLGYLTGDINGLYDDKTKAAVMAWQNKYNASHASSPITVDGLVIKETWLAMGFLISSTGSLRTQYPIYKENLNYATAHQYLGASDINWLGVTGNLPVGCDGDSVAVLQAYLKRAGVYPYAMDGQYGAKTKEAVLTWQKNYNLQHPNTKIVEDGVAGKQTFLAMGFKFLDTSDSINVQDELTTICIEYALNKGYVAAKLP